MKVSIDITSDRELTQAQNADLDDMLGVVMANAHWPAITSFNHLGGTTGKQHCVGYHVEIPERLPYTNLVIKGCIK